MTALKSFKVRKGVKIGDYEIVKCLGKGWEGEVYQVVEKYSVGKRVLKLFNPNEFRLEQIKEICSKFEKLSQVSGVIKYYHAGHWEERDAYYLVMEYFEGKDLDTLASKPWPLFKALKTVRNVCRIIGDCHTQKVCVGDLHAGNILINPEECIKIIDIDLGDKPSKEHAIQDVVAVSKLLYTLIGNSSELPDDLRKVLPKKEDAIRNRYEKTEQLLVALNKLMGN